MKVRKHCSCFKRLLHSLGKSLEYVEHVAFLKGAESELVAHPLYCSVGVFKNAEHPNKHRRMCVSTKVG